MGGISSLQNSPGPLKQTLEQASLDVWNSGTSGVGRDEKNLISYYVKGPVAGFLLDARIQRVTGGRKSLDDVMRLAYKRYSGARGFTPEQFRETTADYTSANSSRIVKSRKRLNISASLRRSSAATRNVAQVNHLAVKEPERRLFPP